MAWWWCSVVSCGRMRGVRQRLGVGGMRTLFSSLRFAVDEGEREKREKGGGGERDRWQSGEAAASTGTAQPGADSSPSASLQMPPFPHPPLPHPPSLALISERGGRLGKSICSLHSPSSIGCQPRAIACLHHPSARLPARLPTQSQMGAGSGAESGCLLGYTSHCPALLCVCHMHLALKGRVCVCVCAACQACVCVRRSECYM